MQLNEYKKGQTVFQAGDIAEKFYIIVNGSVNIYFVKSKEELQKEIKSENLLFQTLQQNEKKLRPSFRIASYKDKLNKLEQINKNIFYQQKAKKSKLFFEEQMLDPNQFEKVEVSDASISSDDEYYLNVIVPKMKEQQRKSQYLGLKNLFNKKAVNKPITPVSVQPNIEKQPQIQQQIPEPLQQENAQANPNPPKQHRGFIQNMIQIKIKDPDNPTNENKDSYQQQQLQADNNSNSKQIAPVILNGQTQKQNTLEVISEDTPIVKVQESQQETVIQLEQQIQQQKQIKKSKLPIKIVANENIKNKRKKTIPPFIYNETEFNSNLFDQIQLEKDIKILLQQDNPSDPITKMLGGISIESFKDNLNQYFQDGIFKLKYVVTLNPGQMFGELGLLNKSTRSATIITKTDTSFGVLDSQSFKDILEHAQSKKQNDKIEFFQQNMLKNCGKQIISKFIYNWEKVKLSRNSCIYQEGDVPTKVYMIKKGIVQLQKTIKHQDYVDKFEITSLDTKNQLLFSTKKDQNQLVNQKKPLFQVPLGSLEAGQIFGEIEVLQNTNRSMTAMANSNCVLFEVKIQVIFKFQLYSIFKNNYQLFMNFMQQNTNILEQIYRSIELKQNRDQEQYNQYVQSTGKMTQEMGRTQDKNNQIIIQAVQNKLENGISLKKILYNSMSLHQQNHPKISSKQQNYLNVIEKITQHDQSKQPSLQPLKNKQQLDNNFNQNQHFSINQLLDKTTDIETKIQFKNNLKNSQQNIQYNFIEDIQKNNEFSLEGFNATALKICQQSNNRDSEIISGGGKGFNNKISNMMVKLENNLETLKSNNKHTIYNQQEFYKSILEIDKLKKQQQTQNKLDKFNKLNQFQKKNTIKADPNKQNQIYDNIDLKQQINQQLKTEQSSKQIQQFRIKTSVPQSIENKHHLSNKYFLHTTREKYSIKNALHHNSNNVNKNTYQMLTERSKFDGFQEFSLNVQGQEILNTNSNNIQENGGKSHFNQQFNKTLQNINQLNNLDLEPHFPNFKEADQEIIQDSQQIKDQNLLAQIQQQKFYIYKPTKQAYLTPIQMLAEYPEHQQLQYESRSQQNIRQTIRLHQNNNNESTLTMKQENFKQNFDINNYSVRQNQHINIQPKSNQKSKHMLFRNKTERIYLSKNMENYNL